MAGSGTKGGCTVNLNNMENKAPADMYELKKIKKKENKHKNKTNKKKRKKGGSYFQQQGLEVFLETNSWLHFCKQYNKLFYS